MAQARNEVLVGFGTLYSAPVGEAYPDVDTTPAGNWDDIGYSEDGWAFAADFTYEDVEVAEEVDPIDVLKTAQQLRLVGQIAQPSLENFQIAFGGGTVANVVGPPNKDTYDPPAADAFTKSALLLRVDGTGGFVRDYRLYEAVNTGSWELPHRPAPDKALLAVEFRLILPTTGDIFNIHEANS
jgi:hypothetical protein